MAQKGFIYVAINTSIPGKVKIGRSSRVPEVRMEELSNTSVPTPFICVYSALVEDSEISEQIIHENLSLHRANKSREFFDVPPEQAIDTIRRNLSILYDEIHSNENGEPYFHSEEIEEIARLREEKEKELFERARQDDREKKLVLALEATERAVQFLSDNEEKINRIIGLASKAFIKPTLLNRLEGVPRLEAPGIKHFGNFFGKHLEMEVTRDKDVDVSEWETNHIFDRGQWKTGLGLYVWAKSNSLFLGQWKKGAREGLGIYLWNERHFFVGDWKSADHRLGLDIDTKQRVHYKGNDGEFMQEARQSMDLSKIRCLLDLRRLLSEVR